VVKKKATALPGDGFIEERTRALAIVHLTGRDDLRLEESRVPSRWGHVVHILKADQASDRRFGLILQGQVDRLTREEGNELLRPILQGLAPAQEFPYPVCLFLFVMQTNEAFFTWVAEPCVRAGRPLLEVRTEPDCQPLDGPALDGIVERVDEWYDAFFASVARQANGHPSGNGLQVLHQIIDTEADYFAHHGSPPQLLKLPVRLAFDLAKLGPEHLGDLAGKILHRGIQVLEEEGLLGMKVQIVRDQEMIAVE
jgi:hypothetical protein